MNKKNKWSIRVASFVLAGLCLGGAVLAAGGDKGDPLVTLSYLTKTAIPEILSQVEEQAEDHQADLLKQFNKAIDDYKKNNQASAGTAAYQVVVLAQGQKLSLGLGCEVLLRSGSAIVTADGAPALADMTSGGNLSSGGALESNHLYMAAGEGHTITAQDAVTLMVCGGYTVV